MIVFFIWRDVNKKIISYILIGICAFLLSCNVCYNLTTIIKNNIKLSWDINIFYSLFQLKDFSFMRIENPHQKKMNVDFMALPIVCLTYKNIIYLYLIIYDIF